jgi:hypothetical protein
MKFVFPLLFILISISSFGQDTLELNNQEPIEVKLVEVSDDFVKYKLPNYLDGPVIVVKREEVSYISAKGNQLQNNDKNDVNHNQKAGMIFKSRRHFLSAGLGFFSGNRDKWQAGMAFQSEACYFITPTFGIGVNYNISSSSFFSENKMLHPASKGNYALGIAPIFQSQVVLNGLYLTPTFSIPLKHISIDYKLHMGTVFGSTNEASSTSINYYSFKLNPREYYYEEHRARYSISEGTVSGYSFGIGTAMRFFPSKKHPISFGVGFNLFQTTMKVRQTISGTVDDGTTGTWEEDTEIRHGRLNPYISFVYRFDKRN